MLLAVGNKGSMSAASVPGARFVNSRETRAPMRHRRAESRDVPAGNRLKRNCPVGADVGSNPRVRVTPNPRFTVCFASSRNARMSLSDHPAWVSADRT